MRQGSGSKELAKPTETVKSVTTGLPALRRSGRNSVTPVVPRKSERLNKNTVEGSSSQLKPDRIGTRALSSGDELGKGSSLIYAKRRKVSVETTSACESKEAKRRMDARRFRTLFVERQKKRDAPVLPLASIQKPKMLEKPHQSSCHGTDSQYLEAKDRYQNINNQSETKRDTDSSNKIAVDVQFEEVITTGGNEPSEGNGYCEVSASKCRASSSKFESLNRMSSEDFECVLSDQRKESRPEHDGEIHASVPEDIPIVSSNDNKGSTSHVESNMMEVDSESRVNQLQANALCRESSLHVDVNIDDEEENIHFRDADDLDNCDAVVESAQALGCEAVHVSCCGNEADYLSGKSALSPRKYRFAEYWVPARLSNLQLEQYCSALLSNSLLLRSSSRSDPVGALRHLLVTLRQTCSHPFLVDRNLSSSLLKDVKETEYLDVGIKASGKLQLLDSMLLEMRKRGLRVLILYESIDGRDGIGDILDDFLRQRYDPDSYERVDGGGFIPSKKQAALNKFNDKQSGKFALLLVTHACSARIKLSSIDAIIIHNSEWNPVNDIRALQRIVLDSHHDPIKVFRLFLPQTVEENAMLLAKHNVIIDNSMHNINESNRDKLLMNGASELFDELERFHDVTVPVSTVMSSMESSLLQDVVQELMTILLQNEKQMVDGLSICLKVQLNDIDHGKYLLVSDELITPLEEKWPRDFWSKLLDGRNPQWKYVSNINQRNRKRVQYDESRDSPSNKTDDVVKRRRKVVHDNTDITSAFESEKVVSSDKDSGCDGHGSESLHLSSKNIAVEDVQSPPDVHNNNAVKFGNMLQKSKNVNYTQKDHFLMLKPELQTLCEVLNMPEDVKSIAELFLEFAMEYEDVGREPVTMLQAFQLSVCWVAASLRKININCQESLALAKQHLKFCCDEDDVDYMYLKMGLFKELFIHQIVNDKANGLAYDKAARVFDPEKLMVKVIKQIKKKCRQRLELLSQKQLKELDQLKQSIDTEWTQLDQQHKLETSVARSIHANNSSVAAYKVGIIEDQFSMKQEEHWNNKSTQLKSLEDKHVSEREKENALTSLWKEDIVKEQLEILRKSHFSNSKNSEQKCGSNGQQVVRDGYKNGCLLENQEILNSQLDVLAVRDGVDQSGLPGGPPTLPDAAPGAIDNSIGVDSEVSTSTEVLVEHSTSFLAGGGQLPYGQASNSVNLAPNLEVLESSSGDAFPVASQHFPPSTRMISGSGLLNTPTIVGSQSHSRDDAVGNQHESEAPSKIPVLPLPPSPSAPDIEVDNSSLIRHLLLQGGNSLPSSHIDSEVPVTEGGQAELHVIPSNERSLIENDVGLSAAVPLHQLPHPSSSQQNCGQPILQLQPSQGTDSIQNSDAQNLIMENNIEHTNPSPLTTAVSVSCIPPTTLATTPVSLPEQRDTRATSNFANSLVPDATSASTLSSQVPFVYIDPLQGELERIQKEADHSIKIYKDQKQHLNSECEKEIEEIVAHIRKQYEAKYLELDIAFTRKKKELDSYHKKVFMNKMLAEAFRNKCKELKLSAPPGMSQDSVQRQMVRPQLLSEQQMSGASSAIQTSGNSQSTCTSMHQRHLHATHGHNTLRTGGHTGAATQTPCPTGPGRFVAGQAPGNPQDTHNQMRVGVTTCTSAVALLPRHATPTSVGLLSTHQYHTPPLRNLMGTSSPAEAVISLPIQTVNSSSALFSSNLSRPAASTTSAPSTVNLHSVTGIRAPPPHLRARMSQPAAANATFASSQIQSSNVSLTAPSTINANGPSALQVMHERENQLPKDMAINKTNREDTHTAPLTSASATSAVVCISDED